MEKRGFKFGDYDTAEQGWTLTGWEFTEPELIENYINVPGRLDGPLDASTALTNGDPRYGSRKLTATFEYSETTWYERESFISRMRNYLNGYKCNIYFPGDTLYYATGRPRVEKLYNDLAHASVRVTAICEPWRYSVGTKAVSLTTQDAVEHSKDTINNSHRLSIPTIEVLSGSVEISGEGDGGRLGTPHTLPAVSLSPGTYQLPDFYILPGETVTLRYTGPSSTILSYKEAIL